MNKMTTLGIDLDGTTYDFYTTFKQFWADLNSIDPESLGEEPRQWGFFEDWGCDIWNFHKILREDLAEGGSLFHSGDPYPDAPQVLQRLSEDYKIVIITSRNYLNLEKECEEATVRWLTKHHIPYHDLILSDEKIGRGFDLLFDDAPHIIKAALEANENIVCLDSPVNRHVDCVRVSSWKEFENFVTR